MADRAGGTGLNATRVVGKGPIRAVVSHGWMGGYELYDPFVPFIDVECFTYAFIDARGYGQRLAEAGTMTVEAMAYDVLAVADGLGWERFHVIGHSMGGMAAQRLMVDAPGRLASTILIAPVPASGARIDDARRDLLIRASHSPETRRELIDLNTGRRLDAAVLDRILDVSLKSTNPAALQAYMASWTGPGFEAEARGATVPTLVVAGALDPGAPVERLRETLLSWYPRASLTQMPDVGHYPMQEAPAALAEILATWMDAAARR